MDENKQTHMFSRIVRVTERTTDKHGQLLLAPDITLEGWWTNLDLERLPSGKFTTNH